MFCLFLSGYFTQVLLYPFKKANNKSDDHIAQADLHISCSHAIKSGCLVTRLIYDNELVCPSLK